MANERYIVPKPTDRIMEKEGELMRKLNIALIILCSMIIIPVWHANALSTPIDLNDFTIIPYSDSPVEITPDGSSAKFFEDPAATVVGLSNDPFFGDPQIIFPGILSFEYNFTEGDVDNNDEFLAFVIDPVTGDALNGFEFSTTETSSGVIEWDLPTDLPLGLGLQFQLNSIWTGDPVTDDFGFDSTATVSNVMLTSAAAPVPEPATMILVGTGLFGLLGLGRKKLRNIG